MDSGFVEARSDILPKVDSFMLVSYFQSNSKFISAEMRNAKASASAREAYGDNAVGYVQLKRDKNICVVKATITPEHRVAKKGYRVIVRCDEQKATIEEVKCEDCAASEGGCKHEIALITWLHRRSEEPAPTSIQCYWKKSKLSKVGTSLKLIKAKDLGSQQVQTLTQPTGEFLQMFTDHSLELGVCDIQITKYFSDFNELQKVSIHCLVLDFMANKRGTSPQNFIDFCKSVMKKEILVKAERSVRDQAQCKLWHELRYARITASKAYEASHCKTFDGILVETILGAKNIKDTAAMKRGRELEKQVLKIVETKFKTKIEACGLFLKDDFPIIGASPDGIAKEFVIEIKCPYSENALKRYITSTNTITAKYNGQVQLQMFFANRKLCKFCVASHDFESTKNVSIIDVHFDEQYCQSLLQKCSEFWCKAIFPKIYC